MQIITNKYIENKRIFFWILVILILSNQLLLSQTDSLREKKIKSHFEKDSLIKDTTIVEPKDTIPPNNPLHRFGNVSILGYNSSFEIRKEQVLFENYYSVTELFYSKLPVFPLSLGSYGQFNHFSFLGSAPNNVSFAFNNRQLNDFEYSSYNPEIFPAEFFEKIEIFTGSDAVIFSDNSSGAYFNIQEIRYNTKTPYSKIWITQGGYEFLGVDGIFSQNIMKNWNFTFGFRRLSSDGRFTNSKLDSWNVRAILRWNPSNLTSISLTENYTNHGIGTNGGVNKSKSNNIFDELDSEVNFSDLDERVFRNDLTLTFNSILTNDSSNSISSNVYVTNSLWDKHRSRNLFLNLEDSLYNYSYNSTLLGVNAHYEGKYGEKLINRIGLEFNFNNIDKTPYFSGYSGLSHSYFAHLQYLLDKNLTFSGGMRIKNQKDHWSFSYGIKSIFGISSTIKVETDFSISERIPSLQEGINLNNESHILGIINSKFELEEFDISIIGFYRNIKNEIVAEPITNENSEVINTAFKNIPQTNIVGVNIYSRITLFTDIFLLPFMNITVSNSDDIGDKRFPLLFMGLKTYYRIIKGKSQLNLGVDVSMLTSFKGEVFFPITRAYLPNSDLSQIQTNGINIFAEAKLGNAFVKVTYQNALSQGYYYVPYYPQIDRNFRISVSWSFFD